MLVPWLVIAMAEPRNGHPAPAGRLKAAAMQLMPPLLDGLHARSKRTGMKGVPMEYFLKTLVGPRAASACCSTCAPYVVRC